MNPIISVIAFWLAVWVIYNIFWGPPSQAQIEEDKLFLFKDYKNTKN